MREGERRDGNYLKESNKSTAGLTGKGNPGKKGYCSPNDPIIPISYNTATHMG